MELSLEEKVQHYLYFSYVPEHTDFLWLLEPLQSCGLQFEYTPDAAAAILDDVCDRLCDVVSPKCYVVVPISG